MQTIRNLAAASPPGGCTLGLETWQTDAASRINGGIFMKKRPELATALFALASMPLLAQQSSPASQPAMPPSGPAAQQTAPGTAGAPPQSAPASQTGSQAQTAETAAPAAANEQMSPVRGELVSALDTRTAKTGDNVVVETKSSAKTADGTEIPKGSKLVGHVVAVKPSEGGATSQVALQFDHIELKGGQNMPIHSQIQSISPAGGPMNAADASTPAAGTPMTAASGGTAMPASPGANSASPNSANGASRASGAPQTTTATPQTAGAEPNSAPTAAGTPAAGTVVARTGNIAIQTTSVPGVLLANNAPGQQDPRMAQASSILLGAKKDVQLDGGTQMVVGVAAATGGMH
jgi:hypothetical protein